MRCKQKKIIINIYQLGNKEKKVQDKKNNFENINALLEYQLLGELMRNSNKFDAL